MFIQWGWVRTPNLDSDVKAQLSALKTCNLTLYDHPELLASLPGEEMLFYFGRCWRGTWNSFVPNSMPFVCLSSWLAAGFKPSQFLLVPQSKLREFKADRLLPALANFTGLHYNEDVLMDKEEELRVHCEAPPMVRITSSQPEQPRQVLRKKGGHASGDRREQQQAKHQPHHGRGRRALSRTRSASDDAYNAPGSAVKIRPLVNSHASYTGHDAVRRTQLSPETYAELQRLAKVHGRLLNGLGIQQL